MNLRLVLTFKWFTEILLGTKRIEYREINDYWFQIIWRKKAEIKTVTFSRGYTNRIITYDVIKIDKGPCPYKNWDGIFYRIHFK